MRISHRLTIGIVVISLAFTLMGYISISQLTLLEKPLEEDIPNTIDILVSQTHLDSDAQLIKYYDEVLTQSARNYAFTGDIKWAERYQEYEPLLDEVIDNAINKGDTLEKEFFNSVDAANMELVTMEYQSIDLVKQGNPQEAIMILESPEYKSQKLLYEQALRLYVEQRGVAYHDTLIFSTSQIEEVSQNTKDLIQRVTDISIFGIIIAVSVGVGFTFFILNSITSPIKKLKQNADLIASGNRDVKITVGGDDEIEDLALSFSQMLESISNSEQKIRVAEETYRKLYEDAPEMYRTVNLEGDIIDCNKAYCEKLGYGKEEIIGKSLYDFVPESHKDTMRDIFSVWKAHGEVRNREVMLKRKDNTVFPALLSASSVSDEDGHVIGANTLIRDMSDLYNAQKEIEELRIKRLSVVGELTARIAHDLRNPLSVIKNSAEILKITYDEKTDPSQKEQWDRLERGIYRMTHQVDDVLDYIRSPPLKIEENSMSVIIQDTIERIQIPDTVSIHPPTNDVIFPCDAEKLEVVFVNLIMNAIQAFEGKAGDITITIDDDYNSNQSILVQITDNGQGIPNELIEKIFDPLFTTRQVGTGLGLPSCKNIVERHNGKITVDSDSKSGTTFSIVLPKHHDKFLTSKI